MSGLKMKIYNNSPIFVQNILTTVNGIINKKQAYGSHYYSYREKLQQMDHSNIIEQKAYQNKQFLELINYAVDNSPFYKEYYASVDLNSINGVKDIEDIPILSKEILKENIEKMYTLSEKDGVIHHTSGTTGVPIKSIFTKEDSQKRMAYLHHFKAKHGFISNEMKRASLNGSQIIPAKQNSKIFWRDNLASRLRIYSSYHCKGDNLKFYIENLNKYKPDSLDGYPSSLYELARYIIKENIRLDFKPIAIFPTAEQLLPHYKKAIEEAFKCPVRDQYASSEGAPFITECKYGKLHYNIDTGIIEVNKNGEMIVTSFHTHGMPLIRYEIGDKIVMDESKLMCKCGSCHPIVKRIDGRGADYIQSKSKGRFTVINLPIISEEFANSIRKVQFIQNKIQEVEILLEVEERYKIEMNKKIIEKLKYILGDDMEFIIKVVDEIPKEESGKSRVIKNNLI